MDIGEKQLDATKHPSIASRGGNTSYDNLDNGDRR